MSLREYRPLQNRRTHSVAAQRLALPLDVTTKHELFHETGCQRKRQERERLDLVLCNHRAKRGAVALKASQEGIRHVPDHCHRRKGGKGDAEIAGNHPPVIPFCPYYFAPRDLSFASDADQGDDKAYP